MAIVLAIAAGYLPGSHSASAAPDGRPVTSHAKTNAAPCPTHNTPRGTATFSDWQFPDTLNPFQTSRLVTRELANALFEHLFQYDNNARLIPQLAEQVPTVANGGIKDGGKTIVVQLKKGLHWSNGAEITSIDLWFGWRVGMDPATGPDCLGSCDAISRIDLPSRYTAVVRLKKPYSSAIPGAMPDPWPHSWPHAWRDDPHTAALKLGQDTTFNFENSSFPTNGPYQVTQFADNKRIVLQPMKYYNTMTCGSYLQKLIFSYYSSKGNMLTAAAAKKTDITSNYSLADIRELNKHRQAFRVRTRTSFTLEHLELNTDATYGHRANPLADTRVRLALALALDKYALVRNALAVNARTAAGLAAWSPFVFAPDLRQPSVASFPSGQWDPIARTYVIGGSPVAVKDARALLAQTRFKSGFTLDFYTTSGNEARQAQEAAIASSWSKLGIKVKPNYVSDSKLLGTWSEGGVAAHGEFQVAMFAYLGSPDPDSYRYNLASRYCDRTAATHSSLNGNNGCVHDPLIDRTFRAAATSLNSATRARDYAAIGVQVNKNAYWIPLYFRPSVSTDDGRVSSVSNNPTQLGLTWNVYAWRSRSP